MGAMQTGQGAESKKKGLIVAMLLGATLVLVSVYSLSRAMNKSAVVPESTDLSGAIIPAPTSLLTQEEIERQYEEAMPRPVPVIQATVSAPSAVAVTNQKEAEIILQMAKTKFNQRIVEKMKQYIKDNPTLDTRDIAEQIKKREKQGAQSQ